MTSFSSALVIVLILAYFMVAIIRFILNRRVAKKTREYESMVMEKMAEMQDDLQDRAKNLQESMQMINQEYSKLMKSMSDQHQEDVHLMMNRLEELKSKQAGGPQPSAPSSDLDENNIDSNGSA